MSKPNLALALLLVAAGSLTWSVSHAGDELTRARADNQATRREIERLTPKPRETAALGQRVGEIAPLLASHEALLWNNVTEEKLLKRLSDFTNATRITVTNVALPSGGQAPVGARIERVSVTLKLEGDYVALLQFLALVERDAHFLTVESFAIYPVGPHVAAGEQGRVRATVEVVAYRLAKGA